MCAYIYIHYTYTTDKTYTQKTNTHKCGMHYTHLYTLLT